MRATCLAAIALTLFIAGCGNSSAETDPRLEEIRRLTAPFKDVSAAKAAGYTVWSPDPTATDATCMSSPEGKMGYHLVNVGLRGSAADPANGDVELDPMKPEMLLYEKSTDGTMNLVGVEYLVFKGAWEREHGAGAAPPKLLGQTVPYSDHNFPPAVMHNVPHYELHVWLHKENPNGMFSHFNPNVSC